MRRTTIFFLCFCATLLALAPAASAKRVALVVGIDGYDYLLAEQQLRKAVNDARTLGETLEALGYEVIVAENADRRRFNESWQKFLSLVEPGDEAAFFFAGHGIEIGGQNYLLPRDIPKPQSGEASLVKNEALSVTQLLTDLQEESPRVSLVILDACRDNPFAAGGVRSVGGTRGLARVEAPEGTFVMYSAGTGQTALDRLSENDKNPNSVFTRSLVPLVKTKGLGLQEVALKVREEVVVLANGVGHKQTPAYYDQVIGRFCVAGCDAEVAAVEKPSAALPQTEVKAPDLVPEPAQSPKGETDVATLAPEKSEAPSGTASATSPQIIEYPELIRSIAFSPDGAQMASGSHDHVVALWDLASGTLLRKFEGHSDIVNAVTFSPDGTLIASVSADDTVRLWDAKAGTLKRTLKGHNDDVESVAFSPDGASLASGSGDQTIRLWDVKTGKLLRTFKGQDYTVSALAFSPDGTRLASAGWADGVTLWDVASGEKLSTFSSDPPDYVDEMALAPDWKWVATATDNRLKLWDIASGELVHSMEHGHEDIDAILSSPDGSLIVSANEQAVKVWDAASGALRLTVENPLYVVTSLAFSPDGSRLALGGGEIKLFTLGSGATVSRSRPE